MKHAQTTIKVNAWVDKGIAPVVEALNRFGDVLTVDSCEGTDDKQAYIYFRYCGPIHKEYQFFQELSLALGSHVPADNEYAIRLEWLAGTEQPMAMLLMQKDYIIPLSQALAHAADSMATV